MMHRTKCRTLLNCDQAWCLAVSNVTIRCLFLLLVLFLVELVDVGLGQCKRSAQDQRTLNFDNWEFMPIIGFIFIRKFKSWALDLDESVDGPLRSVQPHLFGRFRLLLLCRNFPKEISDGHRFLTLVVLLHVTLVQVALVYSFPPIPDDLGLLLRNEQFLILLSNFIFKFHLSDRFSAVEVSA